MSTTDPNPNPIPPTRSGWASPAPASPTAPAGVPTPPRRNSAGDKARTVVGGMVPRLIGLALSLALAYGLYWFFVVHKNSEDVAAALPSAGSCFSWSTDAGAKVLPCTDAAAQYKAEGSSTAGATAAGKTCDSLGAYEQFQVTAARRNNSQTGTICAALNLSVGDCVHQGAVDTGVVPCAQAIGDDVRVLSIQKVASQADAMSADTAQRLCGSSATTFLPDSSGPAIVCAGKP